MTLPTLYKKTSTGAIQTWRIDVEGSTIIATYGQLNGKLQSTRDEILVGKNAGKANATTPEQQALLEATAQWEKKSKKGYVQTVDDAGAGLVDATFITGGIDPMLAQPFAKHGHKIVFPAFTQPKLDGHRCVAIITDSVATLWSRTRKPITGVPHIVAALEDAIAKSTVLGGTVILDGELYNHDYRDRFEELTSFIKRPVPKPGHEVIQYHVYDLVYDEPFASRTLDLQAVLAEANDRIVVVPTQLVADEDEAMEQFAAFLEAGYEGAMLRNASSLYEQKRSYGLQKVKEFEDAEFEIVDVVEGRGKMAGKAIFVCKTDAGTEFRVKMKGTLASLAQYVQTPAAVKGKMLTVQYQGITNDSAVPRFPIGLRIRQDV